MIQNSCHQVTRGYTPVKFDGIASGFEFGVDAARDSVPEFIEPNESGQRAAAFRFGGDILEACCASAAASALAKVSGGVFIDGEDRKRYSGDQAIEMAKKQFANADGMY